MTYDRTKYHYGIFTEILKRQNVYHGSKQVKCLSLVADLLLHLPQCLDKSIY